MERGPKPTVEQIYPHETKKCAKCEMELPRKEFSVTTNKHGWTIHCWCHKCRIANARANKEKNRASVNASALRYRKKNRKALAEKTKRFYAKNKEKVIKYVKEYYNKNRESILKKNKERRSTEKYKKREVERHRERKKTDINYRFRINLRNRISAALKGNTKSKSTMNLIGCTIKFLIEYISGLFQADMTWENYGEWHVDHIRPCASFDLSDPEQQKQCFHYTNLQPLWAEDNMKKGAKW